MKLLISGIVKFAFGLLLVGVLIFLPAGTLDYTYGWLLVALLFVPMLIAGFVMYFKAPELLKKRLDGREKQQEQQLVIKLSGLMFLFGFISAGLNFRYGWPMVPHWLSKTAATLFLLAYLIYAEVLRENTYLSRTIEVQEHQTVIDTGLYGIVRHPMYSATVVLFLSIPLVLGSPISFLIFLTYPPIIVKRIRNEENILEQELEGYTAYKKKVIYKMIPFIW